MHFQTDDEEPGSSESTAERNEREEMLRHFVPVNMLSERTVERMKKMEGWRRQGLVVHYCNKCNYATQYKYRLVNHSRTHSGEQLFHYFRSLTSGQYLNCFAFYSVKSALM